MKKVVYLFDRTQIENLDFIGLMNFKSYYLQLLNDNPFPEPPKSGSFHDVITYLKRKNQSQALKIGAYENITVFEAANRIASDLIIINGLLQLVEKNKNLKNALFTLRLGTTHHVGKGDFTINCNGEELEGEAFNVAPSFLKQKLRNTINKWKHNHQLKYILVNTEAFEFVGHSKIDERVFKVENWHE
ncbi:hypothetical protein KBJ98_13645 [Flavobacterium sp. F-328]|uniref:Uncharacterized protein n=1 Tax=Flavobacterium erciyesense TaxID=2825842 RepID=A0ABS5D6U6_9FLAO|nr:hypothetical protein [Flavobacterium erciyesense]MBQ0909752.1 hypothetical protein [Flavobacterium erciyesense]